VGDGCLEYELNADTFCPIAHLYGIEEQGRVVSAAVN
jgi:hypothetical protein